MDKLSKENGEHFQSQDIIEGTNVIYEESFGKTFDVTIQQSIIINACMYMYS
jgi:hypothetical protein